MAAEFEATHSELSPAASEEVNALQAVFGEHARYSRNTATLAVTLPEHGIVLRFKLPLQYPHEAPPSCNLEVADNSALATDLQARADSCLAQLWSERHGDVFLFDVVEVVRSQVEDLVTAAALRRPREDTAARNARRAQMERLATRVVHSQQPVVVSKSTFVAHACCAFTLLSLQFWPPLLTPPFPATACESSEEIETFLELLLNNRRIATATHNIMAFRIETVSSSCESPPVIPLPRPDLLPALPRCPPQASGGVLADCDDNGEAGAGRQLLQLLTATKARNVCVVVSRWFGGTLLGADRFKIINNTARELLAAHNFITPDK